MFETTTGDSGTVNVRVSFWQCVKAGVGVSLGVVALPALAAIVETFTKIPTLTTLVLLHLVR
jgi:hypothetical protein